jgi:microcystin degradation protein MlrC
MYQPLISVEEAVRRTVALGRGTTILMDAADAPSSGASGDGNTLIRALREAEYGGTILAPIVDAPAVEAAFAAGVGGTIRVTVGGALDPGRFAPLPLEGRVRQLSDGRYRGEAWGETNAGRTAVLESGGLTLVVTSRPVSLHDRGLFWSVGQDPRRFNVVVVKCPHCEPRMFAEWCDQLLNVDAPGATSANVADLGHRKCRRPIFPLDRDVAFEPQAVVFRR